ncbi:MAG: hypothetical protein ACK4N5_26345, partial [Myxococcales bacterium]
MTPASEQRRTPAALLLLLAFAACRDASVKVPARALDEDQQRRVAGHLLNQRPTPAYPSSASFGGGRIRLLGSDARPDPAVRGRALRLVHYFEAGEPLDKSWKLFVHVQNAAAPGILVNADHVPVEELHPTDRWKQGQIIEDAYTVQIPPDAPDELVVFIGFYRFDDRLPVDQREAHDGGNRVPALRLK